MLRPSVASERAFLNKHLSDFAERTKGQRVLDVGAGEGQYRKLFDRHDYESCDRRNGFFKFEADFEADVMEGIPRPDGLYDALLLCQVLEHVPCPLTAVRNVARLLQPGGEVVCVRTAGGR